MLKSAPIRSSRRPLGFSLVEMMVALAAGLIVVSAVIALLLSIMRANQQTIEATRLTQELRATAEVINNDLRRARGVADPLSVAKLAGGNPFKDVTLNGNCLVYAYDGAIGGDYRVVRLNAGKVVIAGAATPAGVSCASPGVEITSNGVVIEELTFTAPGAPPPDRVREIEMVITGRLAAASPDLQNVSRTITQSIFIPSVGTGN